MNPQIRQRLAILERYTLTRVCQIRRSSNTASPAAAVTSMALSGSGQSTSRRGARRSS
jgi:hypothetical protein